jgi:hypothetical protein
MIERIKWSESRQRENPFSSHGEEVPLRITFHSSTLTGLAGDEKEALDALQELAYLPQIEAFDSENGLFPHFVIGEYQPFEEFIPLTVVDETGRQISFTGIPHPRQWPGIASELVNQFDDHPDTHIMLEHLLVAQAHRQLESDLLITTSSWLLSNRKKHWAVGDTNPYTPTEAARIVGLFLRSRDSYIIQASPRVRSSLPRDVFYWMLARNRLPGMWRYWGACVYAGLERQKSNPDDDTIELGHSISKRASRSLQARDAIGVRFYNIQDRDADDEILYHFDYLTLLLSGIFDAQACVAFRAYKLTSTKEREASFGNEKFLKELKNLGAMQLYNLITRKDFKLVRTLIYELRNTIHSVGLESFPTGSSPMEVDEIYLSAISSRMKKIEDAASKHSDLSTWGIIKQPSRMVIEPYTYATTLINESFKLIDEIADSTDVEGLFPPGHIPPKLNDKPPANSELWTERNVKRVPVLG